MTGRKFNVEVYARGDDDDLAFLGATEVEAEDERDAEKKAHEALWDLRLDSASCKPEYEAEEIDLNDELDCTRETRSLG